MYSNEPIYVVKSNFWVYQNDFEYIYIKNWACLKKLSMLKPNFEKADGLGISLQRVWMTQTNRFDF